MTTDKILDKVRKLHAHAESAAKIGNEEEAQAFAAAVQRLLTEHKISMTEVELAADPIGFDFINYEAYGLKTKQVRVAWSERLAQLVARYNFCRIFVMPGSNRVAFVGRRSDAQVAEYLFVTLHRLMEGMAEREYVKYFYECKEQGDVTRARGFKGGWLFGFITRLADRLREERLTQESDLRVAGKPDALLRINNALAQVDAFMKEVSAGKAAAVSGGLRLHGEGMARGSRAADGVSLRANALEAKQKKPKMLGGGR